MTLRARTRLSCQPARQSPRHYVRGRPVHPIHVSWLPPDSAMYAMHNAEHMVSVFCGMTAARTHSKLDPRKMIMMASNMRCDRAVFEEKRPCDGKHFALSLEPGICLRAWTLSFRRVVDEVVSSRMSRRVCRPWFGQCPVYM